MNKRDSIEKPPNVERLRGGRGLELTIDNPLSALSKLTVVVSLLLILITGVFFVEEGYLLLALFFVALILVFAYNFLRLLLPGQDKVYFKANKHKLVVEYPRIFISKRKVLKTSELDQLYVARSDFEIKLMAIVNTPDGQVYKPVIRYLKSLSIAKYLEQELEDHLKIQNRRVIEETK